MKETIERIQKSGIPIPRVLKPILRALYRAGVLAGEGGRLAYKWLVVEPVFRAICREVGPGLRIERIPFIQGDGVITVGSDVYISGKLGIAFSRRSEKPPELAIGNRVFIGHGCAFAVAGRIEIGDDCLLASGVRVMDNDGHPLDSELRRARKPVKPEDIHPIRIGKNAWIATDAVILKGVTIGENAVVGAGSVVTHDVPPNTVVAGNPAVVVRAGKG